MNDIRKETLLGLLDVPRLKWLSKRYANSTVYRWADVGLTARDGTTVKLETVQEGARRVTSEQAVLRFFERLNADNSEARTPSQAVAAVGRAQSTLASAGI